MSSNTTYLVGNNSESYTYCSAPSILGLPYHVVSVISLTINLLSAPVAVFLNALIVAVIWRDSGLGAPSFILLGGLASMDCCTGLIVQPSLVMLKLAFLTDKHELYCMSATITEALSRYFPCVTAMVLGFLSVERWLHMSRRALLTASRTFIIYLIFLFIPVPLLVAEKWRPFNIASKGLMVLFVVTSVIVTILSYIKIFGIIRRHKRQIRDSKSCRQPAINLAKCRGSVLTILYILTLFLASYTPVICSAMVMLMFSKHRELRESSLVAHSATTTVLFLSSSFSPVLYFWRIKALRHGVKQLLK